MAVRAPVGLAHEHHIKLQRLLGPLSAVRLPCLAPASFVGQRRSLVSPIALPLKVMCVWRSCLSAAQAAAKSQAVATGPVQWVCGELAGVEVEVSNPAAVGMRVSISDTNRGFAKQENRAGLYMHEAWEEVVRSRGTRGS